MGTVVEENPPDDCSELLSPLSSCLSDGAQLVGLPNSTRWQQEPAPGPASTGWAPGTGGGREGGRKTLTALKLKMERKSEKKGKSTLIFRTGGEESACYTAITPPLLNTTH